MVLRPYNRFNTKVSKDEWPGQRQLTELILKEEREADEVGGGISGSSLGTFACEWTSELSLFATNTPSVHVLSLSLFLSFSGPPDIIAKQEAGLAAR